jgi:hypothetical protein
MFSNVLRLFATSFKQKLTAAVIAVKQTRNALRVQFLVSINDENHITYTHTIRNVIPLWKQNL